MRPQAQSGYREALSAAASFRSVGVIELKCPVQPVLREIDFGTIQVRQAFLVDNDFNTLVFKNLVVISKLGGDAYRVGPAGTAGFPDTEAQRHAVLFLQELLYTFCRIVGQLNAHMLIVPILEI